MLREEQPLTPALKGLVLAGGDSSRMGFDKGLIEYHGMPQQDYVLQLLDPFTSSSFISRKKGQLQQPHPHLLEDVYSALGPFGGVLSAFKYDSECAWLVVACDFPLIDQDTIRQLIEARDTTAYATGFLDEGSLMPEPWITILEPKIYPVLLDYLQKGRSSLRGILVDYNATIVRLHNKEALLNANTPEEAERLKGMIRPQ